MRLEYVLEEGREGANRLDVEMPAYRYGKVLLRCACGRLGFQMSASSVKEKVF